MRIGKFTNLYRDVTKEGTKIPQEKYCITGQFPIVDQGQRVIAGWWNDDAGIFKDVPAIIFGDHTRAIKYMEEPFFIGADGVKILRPTNVKDNPKYLYYALQAAKIPNLGYSRHFKVVKELEIRMYSRDEQNEIVRVLEKIDYLIEQRHAETTYLDQLVKSRFIELFGDPVTNSLGLNTMPLGKACCLKAGITTSADMIHEQSNVFSVPCYGGNGIRGYVESATQCGCYPIIGRQGALCGNVQLATGKFHATEHAVLVTPLIEANVVWLFYLLKMMDLYRFHTGAAQPGLAVKTLNTVDIPIADVAVQQQFASFVEQTDKSKYCSSLSFRYCQAAANTYRQEWMTCRTSDF